MRGYPERAYAKWVVLHFIWSQIAHLVRSRIGGERFRKACEQDAPPIHPLSQGINVLFVAVLKFFRSKRGKGATAVDVSTFFQRKGRGTEFADYFSGRGRALRTKFRKRWNKFENRFQESAKQ